MIAERSEVEERASSMSEVGMSEGRSEARRSCFDEGGRLERREEGRDRVRGYLCRLSLLPWVDRGGVRGWERGGGSVGRSAAGR